MKKAIFFLSTISLFALTSCSSDDSSSSDQATSTDVLVKRIIYSQEDPEGFNDIINYTYNGNKLVEGNYVDGTKEKYYYTGDLITKIEYVFDGEVEEQELFTYNANGKLIEYKDQDLVEDSEERYLFVYNADNTITETYFDGTPQGLVSTLTIENSEISKTVQTGFNTYKYTYDTKNSAFKNVTGYAEIAYAIHGDFELNGRSHNIVSIFDQTLNRNYMANTIQYNSNDYPTLVTSVANFMTESLTVQYFYE